MYRYLVLMLVIANGIHTRHLLIHDKRTWSGDQLFSDLIPALAIPLLLPYRQVLVNMLS
jgi:hypothetical protein